MTVKVPAKTPRSVKTPARGKTPKSVKKSVKKRTWADVAKKTPAPRPKSNKKMVAHINRRRSGQTLPTFRMVIPLKKRSNVVKINLNFPGCA